MVSNVGNGIDPTMRPYDLAQIIGISISENFELFHAINAVCISDNNLVLSMYQQT